MAPELLEKGGEPSSHQGVGKGSAWLTRSMASQPVGGIHAMESEPGVGTSVSIYLPVGGA